MVAPAQTQSRGNGRSRRALPVRELLEQGEQVRGDLRALASAVRDLAHGCEGLLRERLEERPYATLAIAAGAGYVLGGGVPGVLLRVLFTAAGRLAIETALVRLTTQVSNAGSVSAADSDVQ